MAITLSTEVENRIATKVQSGLYANADDVLREALHLLDARDQSRQNELADLRQDIAIGVSQLDRGEYHLFDDKTLEKIKEEGRKRLANYLGKDAT